MDLYTGLFSRNAARCGVAALAVIVASCQTYQSAEVPVETIQVVPDEPPPPKLTYTGRTAIVRKGDNLYAISFLSGDNYLDVARWNDMDPEDIIYPGQEIKLYPPDDGTEAYAAPAVTEEAEAAPAPTPSVPSGSLTPNLPESVKSDWIWPARGRIISQYSTANRQNGIEIAGELGSPIRVSADGRVVYSGTGLIGYGRIIIVKHNPQYLSVYAHNSRVVVKEGDSVIQGQKIAEMGNTDSDRVKLHFEIRRNGKPIDPIGYLPKG